MNSKAEVKGEISHIKSHKAKYIGSATGLTAGLLYGIGAGKGKLTLVGLALAGAFGGAIIGSMLEKKVVAPSVSTDAGSEKKEEEVLMTTRPMQVLPEQDEMGNFIGMETRVNDPRAQYIGQRGKRVSRQREHLVRAI